MNEKDKWWGSGPYGDHRIHDKEYDKLIRYEYDKLSRHDDCVPKEKKAIVTRTPKTEPSWEDSTDAMLLIG